MPERIVGVFGTRAKWSLLVSNAAVIVIRDDNGPKSVTNDAENVVADLLWALRGRRLFYFDTAGRLDELVVVDGKFARFAPGPTPEELRSATFEGLADMMGARG